MLAKDSDLRKNAKKVSENVAELENEFKRMLAYVKEKVLKKSVVKVLDLCVSLHSATHKFCQVTAYLRAEGLNETCMPFHTAFDLVLKASGFSRF